MTEGQGLHKDQGAGDQGLMFGYACDETPELMPAPIMYAHQLSKQLAAVRKKGAVDFLRPDGKSQVTVEYENDVPKRIETVVVSTQHGPEVKHKALKEAVMELVIKKALPKHLLDNKTKYFVNPTGRFVVGGPCGDAASPVARSSSTPTAAWDVTAAAPSAVRIRRRSIRSACYYARFVAKNIVAAGLAKKCEVQVAYAIGVAQPMGVYVQTFGTGKLDDETLAAYVMKNFDMRPARPDRGARPLAPRVPADLELRSLRPQRVHLGKDRSLEEARRRSARWQREVGGQVERRRSRPGPSQEGQGQSKPQAPRLSPG